MFENGIGSNDSEVVGYRRSYEHSIEWIFVMVGEIAKCFGITAAIRPFCYSALNDTVEVISWYFQFPQGGFDFNLGHRNGTEVSLSLIQEIHNFIISGYAFISVQYPEKNTCVQE